MAKQLFEPGHAKLGGRKSGSVNKITRAVAEQLAAKKCNPIEILAELANGHDKHLKFRAAAELASYVHAQKKAVEVTGAEGGPITAAIEVVFRD
jgi:hypothetical protein